MDITVTEQDGILVVRLRGELGRDTYLRVWKALLDNAADEPIGMVIDADALTVESVAWLVVFDTVWLSVTRWPGIPVLLVVGETPLRDMFDRSGLPRHIPLFRTPAEALATVQAPTRHHRVSARLPACALGVHIARVLTDQACVAWQLESLRETAANVAAELMAQTALVVDTQPGVGLTVSVREDRLGIAVRLPSPIAFRHQRTAYRNIAAFAGVAFDLSCTSAAGGAMVLWTSFTIKPTP
jgi:hypothetical protein